VLNIAAAIWERPALCTHAKMTVFIGSVLNEERADVARERLRDHRARYASSAATSITCAKTHF
jgi:hypothetical protein